MRGLIFWGLFPFVLPQAIRVMKNAPRFAEAGGPKEGSVGAGSHLNLLAIGDSTIAGVGAESLDSALVGQAATGIAGSLGCKVSWVARGSIGANSAMVLRELVPRLPGTEADFIILSVGVNDVTSLSRVSTWTRNLANLMGALKQHSPNAVVAVAGVPPFNRFPLLPEPLRTVFGMRGKTLDVAARDEIRRHPQAVYVPVNIEPRPGVFAGDGYHPSEAGYREYGLVVAEQMVAKFKAGGMPMGARALN